MSRVFQWKHDKTKVKVVFRLQFHATHIPQRGWDKLFVSFIVADSGKTIAKTTKANVRNGNCKWSDPIYETATFLQDAKTKQYDEKLYKLVVSMGSSRSSLLGEAKINLADYAETSKPSSVTLPLLGCNHGTVLHVNVQLLTSKTGFREFKQQRELTEKGLQTMHEESDKISTIVVQANEHANKVNARVGFRPDSTELPSIEEQGESDEDKMDSVGIDGSSHTSESLYAEKHDISSTHVTDCIKSIISGELGEFSLSHGSLAEKGYRHYPQLGVIKSNDWVHGWSSDYSIDNGLTSANEENSKNKGSLEVAEASILELKMEVGSLQSQAEKVAEDPEKFTKQLATEISLGGELPKEVSILKSECLKIKDDLKQLNHAKGNRYFTNTEIELLNKEVLLDLSTIRDDRGFLLHDLHIRCLQSLFRIENKVEDIQCKDCLSFDERDIGSLQPDLEALKYVLQDLKNGMAQVSLLLNMQPAENTVSKEIGVMSSQEVPAPRNIMQSSSDYYYSEAHVSQEFESVENGMDASDMMKEGLSILLRELEVSKAEREGLTEKMNQMECYYEELIKELEESQKQMLDELCNLRTEHSTCAFNISTFKSQMETMQHDMNEQLMRFAEERCDLGSLIKELEKRAITSEKALKRLRWNYSIAVDHLQKNLELLSSQVLSLFETNKTLTRQAFAEASPQYSKDYIEQELSPKLNGSSVKLDEKLKYDDRIVENKGISLAEIPMHAETIFKDEECVLRELERNAYTNGLKLEDVGWMVPLHIATNELKNLASHTNVAVEMSDLEEVGSLQLESQKKEEAELTNIYEHSIHLNVFSNVLQETLYETYDGIKFMKERTEELVQQLEHVNESKELLMFKLQASLDDAEALRNSEAEVITICDDLTSKNCILERKLQEISYDNVILREKFTEFEGLIVECGSHKSKYEACHEEKIDLEKLLEQEILEKKHLQIETRFAIEELKTLKEEFVKQSFVKDDLEKTVTLVRDKLQRLRSVMVSYNEQVSGETVQQAFKDDSIITAFLHLEELHQKACERILHLSHEKKDIEEQRYIAEGALSRMESQFLFVRQKFESEAQDLVAKLDMTNAHVEQLQKEIQNAEYKLKLSSDAEEKYAEKNRELSSKVTELEIELQLVTAEKTDLAQKDLNFNSVIEDLQMTKLKVAESMQENKMLSLSLKAANKESVRLADELRFLKEHLRCTHDELKSERDFRHELEATIVDLTSKLHEKDEKILALDDHKAESVHMRQRISDMELERSRMRHLLSHSEQCQGKVDRNASFLQVPNLETHLGLINEYFLAADIEAIFIKHQFETRMQVLCHQLKSLEHDNTELQSMYLDVVTKLKIHMAKEASCDEENERLMTALQSLKSEFENIVGQKRELKDHVEKNTVLWAEIENHKTKAVMVGVDGQEKYQHELEMEQLKSLLISSEEERDNLELLRYELEVTVVVLTSKLDEQNSQISLLKEYDDELRKLRNQVSELNYKLSEQILKTEEFKNLSVHLKELKDRADIESCQDRDRKEPKGPKAPMQESLRIAFIREQYENKVLELRSQLFVSKKHGEEMLIRLQDALNETESLKKREASHIKRNEELCLKILELENELQRVLSEKREKTIANDQMKDELECSTLSLDCCKEENSRLEASLEECNKERMKMELELNAMKERFQTLCPLNIREQNQEHGIHHSLLTESLSEVDSFMVSVGQKEASVTESGFHGEDRSKLVASYDVNKADSTKVSVRRSISSSCLEGEDAWKLSTDEGKLSSSPMKLPSSQDGLAVVLQDGVVSRSAVGVPRQVILEREDLLQNNTRHIALNKKNFKEKRSRSSMDHLHKEETMKSTNLTSLYPQDEYQPHSSSQGFQRELLHLQLANECLGSIYPSFSEITGSGNALERVLALEIELAEALQAKKSTIHFQSSFLKQHNDEEAIFQSFRDINELIKDMLEVKRKYVAAETELKEMHDRYSQLSLQFAEMEGERQNLIMTLKHTRPPKKT